ncbi:GntR family transcriptional regulator [Phototrophicus methaneseepsis]|uniref:GntR family transcriptional regulator n=1 Tax=Phototrophicus methaneseepsis TaxID=2710758 RepID=A0A7S8E6K9_9CHLR|nr:GntR family transcriptional regulator [Phototrophicus methaneseepsis]QPC81275.1 GntR family transcriptional regulator [Phototrophicus methaneseepsis]
MGHLDIKISHESVIPLHEQLTNQIRHLILSKRWPAGFRLPSETELQKRLRISRSTIRHALRTMEMEGLIERMPGRGTFVTQLRERSNSNRPIAFMVTDFERPMQRQLLSGAEGIARAAGYPVFFCNSASNVAEERRLLEQIQHDDVMGVLLWPSVASCHSEYLAEMVENHLPPITVMDRTFNNVVCDYVASDNYAGGYSAVQHLIELGHEHIGFLSCRIMELLPIADRYRGYQDAMRDAGLEPYDPWLFGEPDEEIHFEAVLNAHSGSDLQVVGDIAELLKQHQQEATAIFAINDNVALLASKAANRIGLRIPDDLSVVGFDDIDIVSYLPTPLTTVAQDYFAIGQQAAKLLIERIEGCYSGPPRVVLLPTQLRARASTSVASRKLKHGLND